MSPAFFKGQVAVLLPLNASERVGFPSREESKMTPTAYIYPHFLSVLRGFGSFVGHLSG